MLKIFNFWNIERWYLIENVHDIDIENVYEKSEFLFLRIFK